MACEYICDGCGHRAPAIHNSRDYLKPPQWYQRSDEDGPQVACSRECIDTISKATGKTGVVLPSF